MAITLIKKMVGVRDREEDGEFGKGEKVNVNLSQIRLCIHTTNPRTCEMETKLFRNSVLTRS